jgi:hypothetical protein
MAACPSSDCGPAQAPNRRQGLRRAEPEGLAEEPPGDRHHSVHRHPNGALQAHPKTLGGHKPENDPVPAFPSPLRRLQFATDFDNSPTPDQMALLWRLDVSGLLAQWRSGAASAPPAPRSSSDRAAGPTPSIAADPLNQPGPKPAGQVKVPWRRRPRCPHTRGRHRGLSVRPLGSAARSSEIGQGGRSPSRAIIIDRQILGNRDRSTRIPCGWAAAIRRICTTEMFRPNSQAGSYSASKTTSSGPPARLTASDVAVRVHAAPAVQSSVLTMGSIGHWPELAKSGCPPSSERSVFGVTDTPSGTDPA